MCEIPAPKSRRGWCNCKPDLSAARRSSQRNRAEPNGTPSPPNLMCLRNIHPVLYWRSHNCSLENSLFQLNHPSFSFKHPTFQTPSFRLKWWLKKHCIVFTQRNPGRFHTLHVFLESLNRSLIPYWSKNLFLNYRNKWMFKFMSFCPLEYFIKFCRACANASKILLMKSNCTVMWF